VGELIVGLSVALALIFVATWAIHPGFRAWIERPKEQFQDALQQYDRAKDG
jgi:hypothetical protein